jgi:dynein heavy chain
VRKNLLEPVKTVDNNVTQSSMRLLDCFFANYIESEIKKVTKDEIANLESMITQLFIFALVWSIGCTCTVEGRIKFNSWFRERMQNLNIEFPEEK